MRTFSCLATLFLHGCIVVPVETVRYEPTCELSSSKKTLRVVNVARETRTYYSIDGLVATPILFPATALLSGAYVAVNNVYNLGEEKLVCGKSGK